MYNNKQKENISKNLIALKNTYKEKQIDVAEAVGIPESTYSEYINLLALKKTSSEILNQLKNESELTIINKKSEFVPETKLGERLWQLDKLATDLYNQLIYENINLRLHNELTCSVRTV